ncbi:unnamed protein product, partial [Hapterophycus canaliculatus]
MRSAYRDALVALLHSTSGADWKRKDNWETDADLSRWYGIVVDSQGRKGTLSLPKNNLEGMLEP